MNEINQSIMYQSLINRFMRTFNIIIINLILIMLVGWKASAQTPTWSVNPVDFQYTGTLTGVLIQNDTIINQAGNKLGAFVNGQVRGVANPTFVNGTYMYFITMYSNVATGEMVTFKAYTAADDSIHTILDSVTFVSGASFGSPTVPDELHLNQNIAPYWNAFSIYTSVVDSQFSTIDLSSFLSNNGNLPVEYQIVQLGFNLSGGIVGNSLVLNHLGNTGLDSVLVEVIDSIDSTVYDQQFIYFQVTDVNDPIAFSTVNDFVLGTNSNSCLNLGAYLANIDNDPISWSISSVGLNQSGDTAVNWNVNPSNFQYSMNFAIDAKINGVSVEDANYKLGAFMGDSLVGTSTPQFLNGKWTCFQTVYSNAVTGEIEFKIWDSNDSIVQTMKNNPIDFVADGIQGAPGNLFEIYFGTHTYELNEQTGELCITLFDSSTGLLDSFVVIASESGTTDFFTDTTNFSVSFVNENQPFLVGIMDQTILASGTFVSFDLDNYLVEMDSDVIIYSVSSNDSVIVNIDGNNVVSIIPISSTWFGSDTVYFIATDDNPNGLFDIDTVVYSVVPGIELSGIPDQSINVLQSFVDVNLDNYLNHFYNDPVIYTAESSSLITSINSSNLSVYVPFSGWTGSDTIIITVQNSIQTSLVDSDTIIYSVSNSGGINLPIEFSGVTDIVYPAAQSCFDYHSFLINVDADAITWSLTQISTANLTANLDANGQLCLTLNNTSDFTDSVMIIASESSTSEAYADTVWQIISYTASSTSIELSGIADQTINFSESFVSVDLQNFLTYSNPSNVQWEVSSSTLTGVIQNDTLNVLFPSSNWYGTDTIFVKVMDKTYNNVSDVDTVVYTVQPPTGIEENDMEILIYPNPSNGLVRLEFSKYTQNTQIFIYNAFGGLVTSEQLIENSTQIDLRHLGKGIYTILINDQNSQFSQQLVIH